MKILMTSAHFNIPGDAIPIGGVQRHISSITEEFKKRGHEVCWCYPQQGERIKEFSPDIIIAHDFFAFVPDGQAPQILVYHGWEGQVPPNPAIIKRRQELEKLASKTICIGKYIGKWYGQNPDIVLWGGVYEAKVIPLPRKQKICYIGRLERDLSPQLFIEALKKTDLPYHLEVCGDGSLREDLKKLAKDLFVSVTFRGFVNNVYDYIKSSDIVFASGYLSILEAYSAMRPVVSVCENELKWDYLKLMPCAPFVCKTSGQVARVADYLYQNTSEENLKLNYDFAMENTWEKVVDKYEELIREIVK